MIAALLTIFALAALAPWLHRLLRGWTAWVLALPVLAVAGYFLSLQPQVAAGEVMVQAWEWAPSLGLALAFRIDGWSLLFLLLISGIGVLVIIYAGGYLHGHRHEGRFYGFILLFMGSMLGLVGAENLLLMFIFWELTSLSSYLLIGFEHENEKARASALQALLVTGGGGLALLAGIILMGQVAGGYAMSDMLLKADAIRQHALYLPILLLVLAGAFTKSAQVPFHFWLPNAMAAPTPVSAYLHSATMVKAGVFLLGRLNPVLGGTDSWNHIVTIFGAATMLIGALLALPQRDLKLLLAYSTVSSLGTLTLLIGMGTPLALQAAAVFLLVHSLYKGALFMVAGAVDHTAGSRDVAGLSGLIKVMPITAVAAGLAALSMSGFPPLLGFISKELLYEANLQAPNAAAPIIAAGVAANIIMVAVAIIVGFRPFHGPPMQPVRAMHEPPPALWLGPVALALAGAVAGLFPKLVDAPFIAPSVSAISGVWTSVELKLWHGLNPVLWLSLVTVAAGFAVYLLRHRIRGWAARVQFMAAWGPEGAYRAGLRGLMTLAVGQTRLLQHGYLRGYVLTVLAVAAVPAALAGVTMGVLPQWIDTSPPEFHEITLGVMILVAALIGALAKSRLTAVMALGVVGYSVALIYALYGAPDLAITQILIETLTLVLFVLVVVHLPRFSRLSGPVRRLFDAAVATAAGVVITLLTLKSLHVDAPEPVSAFFAENATRAQGRNVVNVILVDFRALDTLGEITVLAMAGLGVFALLKLRPKTRKEDR
jgi:multicomponent Na+:H+ antiporter subunit A